MQAHNSYYGKTDVLVHVTFTPEQEAETFARFYAGDPENLAGDALEARNVLVENNLRWAASLAQRHVKRRDNLKEVMSAANLGLIKALESRRFDPSQGRFTTFATKYILGEICACFRVSGAVSFPAGRLPDWPDEADPEPDTMADANGFLPEQVDHASLHAALENLPETERELLGLLFFSGESVASSARIMGVSRQWAHEVRTRALTALRNQLTPLEQAA